MLSDDNNPGCVVASDGTADDRKSAVKEVRVDVDLLSDYEKLRLEKIKRNEERLKDLGLYNFVKIVKPTPKQKAKKKITSNGPQRRSLRKRKMIVDYSEERFVPAQNDEEDDADGVFKIYDNDAVDDDEYDDGKDGDDDDDHDDDDVLFRVEKIERPRKQMRRTNKLQKKKEIATAADTKAADSMTEKNLAGDDGLTLELAKTGRSTCRKCMNKIDKGEPRVGMLSWIVGRNALTWQHPSCCLQNLNCVYEKSNMKKKGKCKLSGLSFQQGDLKIGIRSHTATSYYHMNSIGSVLQRIVSLSMTKKNNLDGVFELTLDHIKGQENLVKDDRDKLNTLLKNLYENNDEKEGEQPHEVSDESSVSSDSHDDENEIINSNKGFKQYNNKKEVQLPQVGTKSRTKGKVVWKFAGHKCYGTLLPAKETKTHCYARTHKGNVKTLAKGKDYWSVL